LVVRVEQNPSFEEIAPSAEPDQFQFEGQQSRAASASFEGRRQQTLALKRQPKVKRLERGHEVQRLRPAGAGALASARIC
jgi:hypothetical protein